MTVAAAAPATALFLSGGAGGAGGAAAATAKTRNPGGIDPCSLTLFIVRSRTSIALYCFAFIRNPSASPSDRSSCGVHDERKDRDTEIFRTTFAVSHQAIDYNEDGRGGDTERIDGENYVVPLSN